MSGHRPEIVALRQVRGTLLSDSTTKVMAVTVMPNPLIIGISSLTSPVPTWDEQVGKVTHHLPISFGRVWREGDPTE